MGIANLKKQIKSTKQPSLMRYSTRKITPRTSANSSYITNKKSISKSSIEGISVLSFPQGSRLQSYHGSMTVEAAIVLPLFLFFFLNLLWIIEIYSLHSTLLAALRETGRELSVYAYAYDSIVQEEEDTGLEALIENAAFSYLYVKGRVESQAGVEYLEGSPLTYGRDGLLYVESSILQKGDIIDLVVTYQVSPLTALAGFRPARFYSRYYGRAWTGYDVAGEQEKGEMVYVAENAEVYHVSRDCTHIRLSIAECNAEEVAGLRNDFGSRYGPCRLCVTDGQGRLYITANGDCYHQNLTCSGLKRTIAEMPRSEAEKYYRRCLRCGR